MLLNDLLVDGLGLERTGLDLGGNGAGRVGQLCVAAVVQAEVDNALFVVLCQVHHVVHGVQHALLQTLAAAAEQDLAAALVHLVGNRAEVIGKEVHQVADLLGVAAEILGGENIERQHKDAAVTDGIAGDLAQAVKAGLVAHADGQHALLGPAAVAVHDDGDMGREAGFICVRHIRTPFYASGRTSSGGSSSGW